MAFLLRPSARSAGTAARLFVLGMVCYLGLHGWLASRVKPLWMDEVISYTLVTDPSFTHALAALGHGADGGFPSYYFAAWPVAHWLGPGETTLRLVSSAFMAAAFALLFRLLRRAEGLAPAMLAVAMTIGGSTLILYMNSELRFYADLFFSATVAVVGYDRLSRHVRERRWPAGAMLLNAAGHALLVLCHPFGIVYSAAASLAALVTFWRWQPKGFLAPYLVSAAGGSALFLLWLPGFLQQARIVAGRGSLPVPSVADFFRIYTQLAPLLYYEDRTKAWLAHQFLPVRQHPGALGLAGGLAVGIAVAAAILIRQLWVKPPSAAAGAGPGGAARPADGHLLILAAVFVLVPTGVWVESRWGKPLFLHRYFIPSVLGFAILYARAFAALGGRASWPRRRGGQALAGAAALGFAAVYVAWPLLAAFTAPDGHAAVRARIAQEARGVPVLCNSPHQFWQLSHYAPNGPYWFVLDSALARDPRSGVAAESEDRFTTVLMADYPALHLLPSDEFLRRNPEFILDYTGENFWYDTRLRNNPAYFAKEAAGLPPGALWLARTASH